MNKVSHFEEEKEGTKLIKRSTHALLKHGGTKLILEDAVSMKKLEKDLNLSKGLSVKCTEHDHDYNRKLTKKEKEDL